MKCEHGRNQWANFYDDSLSSGSKNTHNATNIKSLCCTSKTNMLYVNYTSYMEKRKKKNSTPFLPATWFQTQRYMF